MVITETRRKWIFFVGILKDRASLLNSSKSTKRKIIRSTTHNPSSLPSETRIKAVVSLGDETRATANACIESIMDRLHKTHNSFVALKCLILLHKIILEGSKLLKEQLCFYPSSGGRNFLNLSTFVDDGGASEISPWVRWYAGVIEQILTTYRILGFSISSSFSRFDWKNQEQRVSIWSNSDLMKELNGLVEFAEQLSNSPDSYDLQRNNMVYKAVKLSTESYRLIQHEISIRVTKIKNRVYELDPFELTQLIDSLNRLENCRERLKLLFINKARNDLLWDSISETKNQVLMEKKMMDERRLIVVERRGGSSRMVRFLTPPIFDPKT